MFRHWVACLAAMGAAPLAFVRKIPRYGRRSFVWAIIAGFVVCDAASPSFAQQGVQYSMAGIPPPSSITQVRPPVRGVDPPTLASMADFGACFDVRANRNLVSQNRPQVEPSVASNPANLLQLVAGFADFINDGAPGVSTSTDGGQTWMRPTGGAIVPNPPGFLWGNRTLATHLAAGDSAVAWALDDTVYFSVIGFHDESNPPNGACGAGGLYVYRSMDGGQNWTLPANGPAIANSVTVFRDKEYIAADSNPESPYAGRVYMVWNDDVYSGCPHFFPTNFVVRELRFSISTDDGATWSSPTLLASGCYQGPVPAVAANGDVYVAWYDCNAGIRQLVRKSTDGGVTFGPILEAAAPFSAPPSPLVGSSFRIQPFPSIATDPSDSDNVYVTWCADNGTSQVDVFVSRSLDGGANWAGPVRVNDDPVGNPRDQFFPWISVGDDGTVWVMWGDDRLDLANAGGKNYHIFMAESVDHGTSFSPNVQITSAASNPDFDGFGGGFIGDYFGLSRSGVAVWDDCRTSMQQQDIFAGTCVVVAPPALQDVTDLFPNDASNVDKNRFLSVVIPAEAAGQELGIRVEMVSMAVPPAGPGTPSGRQFRYVTGFGPGDDDFDCSGSINFGQPYKCGQLVCSDLGAPIYRDWGDMAGQILHITGDAVHAGSQYAASMVPQSCGDTGAADMCSGSQSLALVTAVWGDHADAGGNPLMLDGVANVIDISFAVDKVKDLATALPEPRIWKKDADPDPNLADVNVLDAAFTVDAVKTLPYPASFVITACP